MKMYLHVHTGRRNRTECNSKTAVTFSFRLEAGRIPEVNRGAEGSREEPPRYPSYGGCVLLTALLSPGPSPWLPRTFSHDFHFLYKRKAESTLK